ncbi:MAG TPA: pitrilysin family protein [Pyrinomonadaceae bacterium]|jgi:predicted Zn-dependent peptidase
MNTRTFKINPIKSGFLATLLLLVTGFAPSRCAAQTPPEPQREQLLNGLNVLVWHRPADPLVLLKLRIHSGAAFDLAGKGGTMALLADALFPSQTTRDYFTEELGGRLEVTTDQDAINVTMTGRASEFERIVDQLRAGIVNTPFPADTVSKLRDARLKIVSEAGIAPNALADKALAARLYRDFPYGRPSAGTPETLSRLDRTDLIYARDRFLSPNNATLVVIGGVDERRAARALRQLLGMWRKSESVPPSTFRQPDAPDTRTLVLDLPGAETAEIRLGARSLARSDRDAAAMAVLSLVVRDRWLAAYPDLAKNASFVRDEAHVLPGIFVMGAAVPASAAAPALSAARDTLRALAKAPPTATEFMRAKSEATAVFNKQLEQPETIANLWLDVETYKLGSVAEQSRALNQVTAADVQRLAARLFGDGTLVTVVVGSAAQLSRDLEREGKVEITSATTQTTTAPKPAPTAPARNPF